MAGGSGTQQDPYIFESFTELLELQLEAQDTDYFEYGGNATEEDFNNILPQGIDNTIILRGNIDFKDLVLSNVRSFASDVIELHGSIKNVKFKNLLWVVIGNTCNLINANSKFTGMYNVRIYATVDITNQSSSVNNIIYATDSNSGSYEVDKCVFVLSGSVSEGGLNVLNGRSLLKDCNILFDNFNITYNLVIHYNSNNAASLAVIGCYIGGAVTCVAFKDYDGNNYGYPSMNVINIDTSATIAHKRSGLTVFNSTKAPNFVEDTLHRLIGVNDTQIKNPEYLQSVGFPCYGGDV